MLITCNTTAPSNTSRRFKLILTISNSRTIAIPVSRLSSLVIVFLKILESATFLLPDKRQPTSVGPTLQQRSINQFHGKQFVDFQSPVLRSRQMPFYHRLHLLPVQMGTRQRCRVQ